MADGHESTDGHELACAGDANRFLRVRGRGSPGLRSRDPYRWSAERGTDRHAPAPSLGLQRARATASRWSDSGRFVSRVGCVRCARRILATTLSARLDLTSVYLSSRSQCFSNWEATSSLRVSVEVILGDECGEASLPGNKYPPCYLPCGCPRPPPTLGPGLFLPGRGFGTVAPPHGGSDNRLALLSKACLVSLALR